MAPDLRAEQAYFPDTVKALNTVQVAFNNDTISCQSRAFFAIKRSVCKDYVTFNLRTQQTNLSNALEAVSAEKVAPDLYTIRAKGSSHHSILISGTGQCGTNEVHVAPNLRAYETYFSNTAEAVVAAQVAFDTNSIPLESFRKKAPVQPEGR